MQNKPKAVLLGLSVATDLAVPVGHEAGLAEYLDQLTLVVAEECGINNVSSITSVLIPTIAKQ